MLCDLGRGFPNPKGTRVPVSKIFRGRGPLGFPNPKSVSGKRLFWFSWIHRGQIKAWNQNNTGFNRWFHGYHEIKARHPNKKGGALNSWFHASPGHTMKSKTRVQGEPASSLFLISWKKHEINIQGEPLSGAWFHGFVHGNPWNQDHHTRNSCVVLISCVEWGWN